MSSRIVIALIGRGQWKYLAYEGSGGNNYQANPKLKALSIPDNAPAATGQLDDPQADPGEVTNLALVHPEIDAELEALLKNSIASSRSQPSEGN